MSAHPYIHSRKLSIPLFAVILTAATALLGQTITTTTGTNLSVTAGSTTVRSRGQNPLWLGLNVSWPGIQTDYPYRSNLWDSASLAIRPALIDFLKTDYTGTIYRFGTYTTLDWDQTVGPLSGRGTRTNSSNETFPVQFGTDEFLRFVEQVKGEPMLIMNLLTFRGAQVNTAASWQNLKTNLLGFVEYCNAPTNADWNGDGVFQGQQRANNGRVAPYNVTRWELGNEVDTSSFYTKELYAQRCAELGVAMLALQPGLSIVAHARTSPWSFSNWRDWHNELLLEAGDLVQGIAWHPYYDGYSINTVGNYTNQIWNDSTAWASATGETAPGVYITEHGSWPNLSDLSNWPKTTSMTGALSVTDMIISNEHRTFVRMAVNHEMAAVSPWAMFSEVTPGGTYGTYVWNTTFAPRPQAYVSKLIHRALTYSDILGTTIVTPKTGTYEYDVRATGYQYGTTGVQGAFLANRASSSFPTTLTLPGIAPGQVVVRSSSVGGPDGETGITERHLAASAGSGGAMALRMPARTVQNWTVLGRNLTLSGDFEQGTLGSTPTNWSKGNDAGVTGTTNLLSDATSVNGGNIVRLQKTAGSGYLSIYQPGWGPNTAFGSSGEIAANPESTIVLRANVRTSGVQANSVFLRMNCFSTAGFITSSPASAAAPSDTAGRWVPLQIEFSPSVLLPSGTTLNYVDLLVHTKSPTGYVDLDGITVMRRTSYARNGKLADIDADGMADKWDKRIPAGTAGGITYSGAGNPVYITLSKTAGAAVQLAQTSYVNSDLGSSGTLDARRNEKWRLRARVRYQNLDASGARLKVQYFDSSGSYSAGSPLGAKLTGSNSTWTDVNLEFQPREMIGAKAFGRAELIMQNDSNTGSIDVAFVSLEVVD